MPLKNTRNAYGWIAIALHWLVAIAVIGLFALGLWMTGLSYYHEWYHPAPNIHKSIGILLFIALTVRLLWKLFNPAPQPEPTLKTWEVVASTAAHWGLYLLLFALMISGYLISTAKGDAISVFGLFNVPATLTGEGQADLAGEIHYWLAWSVIGLASVHALAALKHHFIDRDATLLRMLRSKP
ncbi:MAG: cytochrome b [Pseudomonadota bacterium]